MPGPTAPMGASGLMCPQRGGRRQGDGMWTEPCSLPLPSFEQPQTLHSRTLCPTRLTALRIPTEPGQPESSSSTGMLHLFVFSSGAAQADCCCFPTRYGELRAGKAVMQPHSRAGCQHSPGHDAPTLRFLHPKGTAQP